MQFKKDYLIWIKMVIQYFIDLVRVYLMYWDSKQVVHMSNNLLLKWVMNNNYYLISKVVCLYYMEIKYHKDKTIQLKVTPTINQTN